MKGFKIGLRSFLTLFLVTWILPLLAAEQRYASSISKKDNIKNAPLLTVENPEYIDPIGNNSEVTNHVNVSLVYSREERSDVASAQDWKLRVSYTLTFADNTTATGALLIQHEAGGEDIYEAVQQHEYVLDASFDKVVELEVNSVLPTSGTAYNKVPDDIRLDLTLISGVYHKLDAAHAPDLNLDISNNVITWGYLYGAESYELEWAFVDQEMSQYPTDPFKNAVRITTSDNYYDLDQNFLTYPNGTLYFRVRAVGVFLSSEGGNLTQIKKSSWSTTEQTSTNAFDFQPDKNWTFVANYAEDGKSKKVVSYFDGSNRSRQVVTNLSTQNQSLVADTWYDYEGRNLVTMLPVPDGSNNMLHRTGFNTLNGGSGVKSDYDRKTGFLSLDNTSGTSQYYSSNNSLNSIHKDYIPDAQGYAYMQKKYLNDNSGRLNKQSGIGYEFRPSGGKETEFYYGDASSTQIKRLFGENVGKSSHYRRNVTIDPNGQVSVSYVDQYERIIATALDGGVPQNMLALSTFSGGADVINLNDNNVLSIENRESKSVSSVFNPSDLLYTFSYDFTGGIFQALTPCATCEYDLSVKITDPDGLEVPLNYSGNLINGVEISEHFPDPSISCDGAGTSYSIPSPLSFTVQFDKVGSYTITKVLNLSEEAINTILSNPPTTINGQTLVGIEEGYLSEIDSSSCDFTCAQSCSTAADLMYSRIADPTNWQGEYDACLLSRCGADIEIAIQDFADRECNVLKEQMMLQCSPGGKYFEQTAGSSFWITIEANKTSFPLPLPGNITVRGYLHSTQNGIPNYFWQDYYAEFLASTAHPEYCHYQQCVKSIQGSIFDKKMVLAKNWSEAVVSGVIDPLNQYSSANATNYGIPNGGGDYDNFILYGGITPPYNFPPVNIPIALKSLLLDFVKEPVSEDWDGDGVNGDFISLWEFVSAPEAYGVSTTSQVLPDYDVVRWNRFQSIYRGLKQIEMAKCNEDPSGCNCPYIPADESPIIFNPLDLPTTEYEINSNIDQTIDDHCDGLCPEKVDQWMNKILAMECIDPAKLDQAALRQHLAVLCDDICGFSNPMAFLSQEVVDGDYFKMNVLPLIADGGCVDIKEIISPIEYTTECVEELAINECFKEGYTFSVDGERGKIMLNFDGESLKPTVCVSKLLNTIEELILYNSTTPDCNGGIFGGYGFHESPLGQISWTDYGYRSVPITLDGGCMFGGKSGVDDVLISISQKLNSPDYVELLFRTEYYSQCSTGGNPSAYWHCPAEGTNYQQHYAPITHCNAIQLYFNIQKCGSASPNYIKVDYILEIGEPFTFFGCQYNDPSEYFNLNKSTNIAVEIKYFDPSSGNILTDIAYIELDSDLEEIQWKESDETKACEDGWTHKGSDDLEFNGCVYAFYDEFGNHIDFSDRGIVGNTAIGLTDLVYSFSDAAKTTTSPLGISYNGLKFQNVAAKVTFHGRDPILVYVYSSCDPQSLFEKIENCYTTSMGPTKIFNETFTWEGLHDSCVVNIEEEATYWANELWEDMVDDYMGNYLEQYIEFCMNSIDEDFYYSTNTSEHHYTLYYYDQSGNLVQTVPPQGVEDDFANVNINSSGEYISGNPSHDLETQYKYNSVNQLIEQSTPDGGVTKFWYDSKGQLRLSQNDEQANTNYYSFTKYDAQGRVVEVGEVQGLPSNHTPSYFNGIDGMAKLDNQLFPKLSDYVCDDISQTTYDQSGFGALSQQNLRGRVSEVSTWERASGGGYKRLTTTTYSYDAHGNVKKMLQTIREMEPKLIEYDYDLVSGNVNYVYYQDGEVDQMIHKYTYDADNRITEVFTSVDGVIWDRDARYFYYDHGPLARVEIGEDNVQGLDYYYTLQGWLKGINIPEKATAGPNQVLDQSVDLGRDGNSVTSNLNRFAGRDEMAIALGYFSGDYTPIGSAVDLGSADNSLTFDIVGGGVTHTTNNLYNGNISYMQTAVAKLNSEFGDPLIQTMAYKYDQLNRLIYGRSYRTYNAGSGNWSKPNNYYDVDLTYDKNGNIKHLVRSGNAGLMDDLTYNYNYVTAGGKQRTLNNKLRGVNDAVASGAYTIDIDNQTNVDNYVYDDIGNLTSDLDEQIDIEWNAYGKVDMVNSTSSSGSDIVFVYDASGSRVAKRATPDGLTNDDAVETLYIRDASGNVMAVYENTYDGDDVTTELKERHIYGSGRLGLMDEDIVLGTKCYGPGCNSLPSFEITTNGGSSKKDLAITEVLYESPLENTPGQEQHLGEFVTIYNFGHEPESLGNVKLLNSSTGESITFAANERITPGSTMLIAFGNMANENQLNQLLKDTIVDSLTTWKWQEQLTMPNTGGRLELLEVNGNINKTIDLMPYGQGNFITTNERTTDATLDAPRTRPETIQRDRISGDKDVITPTPGDIIVGPERPIIRPPVIGEPGNPSGGPIKDPGTGGPQVNIPPQANGVLERVKGFRRYELSNHLGNVLVVVGDRKLGVQGGGGAAAYYNAEVLAANDYYPFGSIQPGRSYNSPDYRYGFNGQEKEDEITGSSGSHYSAEHWMYDSRIGRRWNVDPVVKYFESPYATFANNPIWFADPLGADTINFTKSSWSGPAPKSGLDGFQLPAPGGSSNSIDVKVAEGKDVFYYTQTHTTYDEDGNASTTSSTQQFHPVEDHKNGITETPYAFGLLSYKDNDRLTLAKLAPTELLDYLADKSTGWDKMAYKGAKALQSTYGVFEFSKSISELTVGFGGFSLGSRSLSALRTVRSGEIYNFGTSAAAHMGNPGRYVPVQLMDDVIRNTKGVADPRGTSALMYYSKMYRNGKAYNLEVLYNKSTNTIEHFKYW